MANYPILAPTIDALVATKNEPTGAEDASKLDDALRQTRNWICDFLTQSFNTTTGKLLPAAVDVTTLTGLIRGSTVNGGTQREILQGSVSDVDLRTGAVTGTKLAALSVGTTHIIDASVTQAKLALVSVGAGQLIGGAVGSAALADNGVTSSKFADGSILGTKLANGTVGSTQLAQAAVGGDKITPCPAGSILVGGNTVNGIAGVAAVKALHGVVKVDADGLTSYDNVGASGLPYIILCERAGQGVDGGVTKTANYTLRGSLVPWFIQSGLLASVPYISIDGSGKIGIGTPGRYLIRADAPATNCNGHKLSLAVNLDAMNVGSVNTYEGTSAYSVSEAATGRSGVTTRSKITVVIDLINCTTGSFCYLAFAHYTQLASTAGNPGDLGRATNQAGFHEIYATCEIVKLT